MEELHNTEVLDREILEDARKKAYRILKTAEDTLKEQAGVWEDKTRRELETLRRQYAERLERSREEILARLPLDKRRLRSETTESLLRGAMKQFLEGLPRERLLAVLTEELRSRLEACAEFDRKTQRPELLYRGLDAGEAKEILATLGVTPGSGGPPQGGEEGSGQDRPPQDLFFIQRSALPGILIKTPQVRISASVDAAAEALLEDKRAELAAALLGEGALDD
jgi:integrase